MYWSFDFMRVTLERLFIKTESKHNRIRHLSYLFLLWLNWNKTGRYFFSLQLLQIASKPFFTSFNKKLLFSIPLLRIQGKSRSRYGSSYLFSTELISAIVIRTFLLKLDLLLFIILII